MSPVLGKRTLQEIRDILSVVVWSVDRPSADIQRIRAEVDRALAPKRSVTLARKRVKAKKQTRKEKRQAVRAAVFERAGGCCEAVGCRAAATDLDHHFGRGRMETVETCRALCRGHHHLKTLNQPSATYWHRDFIAHCEASGYREATEMARARLESLQIQGRIPTQEGT